MKTIQNLRFFFMRLIRPSLFKTQSFTFYIPAPPPRKTGYREKEFDKIFYNLINQGFDILDFKTISHNQDAHSGFWACFILKAKTLKASKLNFDDLKEEEVNNNPDMQIYYDSDTPLETEEKII